MKKRALFNKDKLLAAIKRQCEILGVSEAEVSTTIGSNTYIRDVRRGKTKSPALDKVTQIMSILLIKPEEIDLDRSILNLTPTDTDYTRAAAAPSDVQSPGKSYEVGNKIELLERLEKLKDVLDKDEIQRLKNEILGG